MTAKEYLQQIYSISKRVERLEAQREAIRQEMYSIKSPAGSMTADRVQSSMTGDRIEKLIARVDKLERHIVIEKTNLIKYQEKIVKQIEAMPSERQKDLLHRRYVRFDKWEQIAVDMDMSTRHVYRLHGEALQSFAKLYLCH